ncbi:phage portal protein [Methylobacterium mesophilicum]
MVRIDERRPQPGLKLAQRAYEGASQGRLSEGWFTSSTSADTEIWSASRTLRDRSRELVRNNPHAAKAVAAMVAAIVGDGVMPRPKTGDDAKNRKVREAFDAWASKDQCDADGALDFYGIQTLAVREIIEGGEVLLRRRLRFATDGFEVPVQIQVLESDFLDSYKNGYQSDRNNRFAIQGIEFNTAGPQIGKPGAYWLYPEHPGSIFLTQRQSMVSSAVPASEILHVFEKQRTQVRGVPWGTPAFSTLRHLGDYEEAELVRKKIEASMVGIVTGDDDLEPGINQDPNKTIDDYAEQPGIYDVYGNPVERFEPGMFAYARGGKTITFNSPATIGGYNEYKVSQLRTIAAGYRVPYEMLSGDLSQVNFSSGRMGLLEFRRFVRAIQWQMLIPMMLQPIWNWFCEAAYLAGKIDSPIVPVEWSPPAFEWINPTDDVAAATEAMRTGQRSWEEIIAESGRDPEAVYLEIKKFQDRCRADGVVLDSDPSATSGRGVAQKDAPAKSGFGGDRSAASDALKRAVEAGHAERRRRSHSGN